MLPKHLDKAMLLGRAAKRVSGIGSVARYNYVHPVTGKPPPALEDFDPMNPGDWQIGAGGKILPRLPEGTRVGKLIMGKYGLYDPDVREIQLTYDKNVQEGHAAPLPSELVTPKQKRIRDWLVLGSIVTALLSYHNFAMCLWATDDEPLWPYTVWDRYRGRRNPKE